MSYYTLAVWYTKNGKRVREIVDPNFRMPFNWADEIAAKLNLRYLKEDRTYEAVKANEADQ
jgi:hypothetical protein